MCTGDAHFHGTHTDAVNLGRRSGQGNGVKFGTNQYCELNSWFCYDFKPRLIALISYSTMMAYVAVPMLLVLEVLKDAVATAGCRKQPLRTRHELRKTYDIHQSSALESFVLSVTDVFRTQGLQAALLSTNLDLCSWPR